MLCNIGDSRVALVGAWTVLDHKGHAPQQLPKMVLSHAHRVTDPEEMARIDAAGGVKGCFHVCWRDWGELLWKGVRLLE